MIDLKEIDYKELKAAVGLLNESCGTGIKVIGVTKARLSEEFEEAMKNGLDNVPESASNFYAKISGNSTVTGTKEGATEDGPSVTEFGNTRDVLEKHAGVLGVDSKGMDDSALEKELLEKIDSLTQEQWGDLPEDTKVWDKYMADTWEKIQADKAAATKAGKAGKKADKKEAPASKKKEPKEPKKAVASIGPRPGWTFTEGTNSFHIMQVFASMFVKDKNGVALKDLQAQCEKEKVKSGNVKNRVSTVMRYAMTEEGGSQVIKKDGKYFPKPAK